MDERAPANDKGLIGSQGRLPTEEVDTVSPIFEELYSCDTQELPYKWQDYYKKVYERANKYRAQGNYEQALKGFRKAQSVIYYVRSKDVFTESMPVREAACSYMIIQCYIELQREPDKVMRELHLMSEVFIEMLDLIDDGNYPVFRSMLEDLKNKIDDRHEINIIDIHTILVNFWKEEKENLTDYQKGWIWKLSYFLTRYVTDAFDFYIECTPHIGIADTYTLMLASIDQFSAEVRNSLSEEYINSDPEGINQIYAAIHRNWMSVHLNIVGAEASFIVGDHTLGQLYYSSDYKENLWDIINRFNEEGEEEVIVQDYEFALELLALLYFSRAYEDYSKYLECDNEFNLLYELASVEGLTRIMIMIKLYQTRLANKYNDNEKVHLLLEKLDELYEVLKSDENAIHQDELFEKWMKLIRADQILYRHQLSAKIIQLQKDLNSRANVIVSVDLKDSEGNLQDVNVWDILEIENMLASYVTKDAKIDRQRGANLPLEAQTYYTLGRVAVEKAKIYGSRLETDPSGDNGCALLRAFYDARNYLCEAYTILKSMGYQEVELIRSVADSYREMLDYNYTLSGMAVDKKKEVLPNFSENLNDMDEIAKHYQIQRWTRIVFDAIRSYTYRPGDDYLNLINDSFEDGIRKIIPEVSSMYVIDIFDESLGCKSGLSDQKQAMIKETIEKSRDYRVKKVYFYHKKGGKLMYCFSLDKENRRKMIIETDIPLADYSKTILQDISRSVDSLLRLFESRKVLEETGDDFPEVVDDLKEAVLQAATDLFDNLFEVHPPTRSHSYGVAQMMKRSAERMKEDDPDCKVNAGEAAYAGLLHDVGKLGLDPKLILDKASKLLPFEVNQVENHTILTARVLRGLLGLKYFKNIIAVASAHHVKYGVESGYPVELPGDSIRYVLQRLITQFPNLTPEEYEFLRSDDAILSDDWCDLAHDIVIFDQIQALRAVDRAYREHPMPIEVLNGYIKSRSGRDFDPGRTRRVVGMIREGIYSDHLIHSIATELRSMSTFDEPDIISWDDLYTFIKKYRNMIEYMLDIPLDEYLSYLKNGYSKGLSLSSNCMGAGLCEIYIQEETEKDPKNKLVERLFFGMQKVMTSQRLFSF